MKYQNIKTGAIVNSPFTILGDNWVLLKTNVIDEKKEPNRETTFKTSESVVNKAVPSVNVPSKEKTDGNDYLSDITVKEIKQELDSLGINYMPSMKKQELYDLMMSQGK